ncbi:MAG: tetratricopeptide repeat protein [Bacteroidales bacterium]
MKTIAKGILTTLFLTLTIGLSFAQKGVEDGSKYGHGEDSIRCIMNLSLYREYVKQDNFNLSIDPWKTVYTECPKASKYIYIDGIKMIKDAIQKEQDEAKKEILVDSMMRIYDKRIKYYGQKGYVLGKKGTDYIRYSKNTSENMEIAYNWLKESIELEKTKSGAGQLVTFLQASKFLYSANKIGAAQVVNDYGVVSDIIDSILKNGKKGSIERAQAACDQIFESSGAASCEDLLPFYADKFEQNSEDVEFLTKATDLLRSTKCTESDLFYKMIKKLNSLEPTADLANEIAKLSNQKEKFEEASKYLKQAIELQDDIMEKAKYYLELGDVTRRLGNYQAARSYALKSLELNPDNGYPYILIGNIYAGASKECGENEFEQEAVYWAAVDKFLKAKQVDPDLADDADRYIKAYTPHFPNHEDAFFEGYENGDTYTVGCWINETTTVRTSK